MNNMTANEMNDVNGGEAEGGGGWRCFAGGLLVGAGLVTGQVEVLAVGLVVAIEQC